MSEPATDTRISVRTLDRTLMIVGVLPLLWWCVTLATGAIGVRYEVIGDVVVTWNLLGAIGLIAFAPAAILIVRGLIQMKSRARSTAGGRMTVTLGFALSSAFALLMVYSSVADAVSTSRYRDSGGSWTPVLSTTEHWTVAAPYALIFLLSTVAVVAVWRRRS